MKPKYLLLIVVSVLPFSCRVNDPKEESPDAGDEKTGVNITDPNANLLGMTLYSGEGDIYKGESTTLSWSALEKSICSLKANEIEIAKDLPAKGSLAQTPEVDTAYVLSCVNGSLTGTATHTLKLLPDETVKIPIFDKEEMASYVDLAKIDDECQSGKLCFFADLEKNLFKKTAQGWGATEAFIAAMSEAQSAFPAPKVIALESADATADLSASVVYGYQGNLKNLKLDDTCRSHIPYSVGSTFPTDLTLINPLSNGFEEISNGLLNAVVYTDLSIEGSARRSIVKKGSDLSVNYTNAEVTAKVSGSYLDYGSASGSFSVNVEQDSTDRTIRRAVATPFFSLSAAFADEAEPRTMYPPVPEGYVLPARGYGGDENAFMPTDFYCNVKSQTVQVHIFSPVKTYGPLTDYFPQQSSKRIVKGPGTMQCNLLLGGEASAYGLGAEWKIDMPDALWFVTDRNWPSCGGYECIGKELVDSSSQTWPIQEWQSVEPFYNYCIDRWAGINTMSYFSSIIDGCRATDVYKAALEKQKANEDNIAFYRKCINDQACSRFIFSVDTLNNSYPPSRLRNLLKITKSQMDAAKSANTGLVLTDEMFDPANVSYAQRHMAVVRQNYQTYEALRLSISPNVNGFAQIDTFQPLESEFLTSDGILKMMDEYDSLFKDLQEISRPIAKTVACSMSATGKFRRYQGISLSELTINPLTKSTKKAQILRDLRVAD